MAGLFAAGVTSGLRFWARGVSAASGALARLVIVGVLAVVALADRSSLALVLGPLAILLAVVAAARLYRAAFQLPLGGGWVSSIWEPRLLAGFALFCLFLGVLGLLVFVIILCVAYAVASAGHGFDPKQVTTWAGAVDARGKIVGSAAFLIGMAGLAWAKMRVSMFAAATVAEDRVAMLSTWPYTRGLVLPMLGARLVLLAPPVLLCWAVWALSSTLSPQWRPWLEAAGIVAVLSVVAMPFQVGAGAVFYERRSAPPPSPAP